MKKLLLLPFLFLVIPVANARGEHYNREFQKAIERGDLESLKREMDDDHYLDINQKTKYNYTGLMTAAFWGEENIVGYLLALEGIDIYHKDREETALEIAIERENQQIIDMLQLRINKDLKEANRIAKKILDTTFTAEQKEKLGRIKIYLDDKINITEEVNASKWIDRIKKGGEFLKADDLTTNLISSLKKLEQYIDELPKTPISNKGNQPDTKNKTPTVDPNKKSTIDIVWYKTTGGGAGIVIVVLSGVVITSIIYKKHRSQRHQNGGRNKARF